MDSERDTGSPEVTDAPPGEDDRRTARPWPYWLMRYVGSDDMQAMEDLIWSVGGSPPYGGVSWEEAGAVYELLEAYRGPGAAGETRYEAVRAASAERPGRLAVLEVFRCVDRIQSQSADYDQVPVERGLALARQLGHRGAQAAFLLFGAGWLWRTGQHSGAAGQTLQALEIYLDLADLDPVYEKRAQQAAQNAVSMTAMSGDTARARALLQQLAGVLDADVAEQLRRALGARS